MPVAQSPTLPLQLETLPLQLELIKPEFKDVPSSADLERIEYKALMEAHYNPITQVTDTPENDVYISPQAATYTRTITIIFNGLTVPDNLVDDLF